jgi:uncharacterized glyoxalase superfamily protein PhnB
MAEIQKGKPADWPRLSVYLVVRKAEDSLDFYEKAFGFSVRDKMLGPDGLIRHAEMTFDDAVIMFAPEAAYGGKAKAPVSLSLEVQPVGMYVFCEDVDALHARAVAAGAKSDKGPENMPWGDRYCNLIDPDGHSWWFATRMPA